jgi:hypothetical protein
MLEADTIFNTADYVFATTQETSLSYVVSATGQIKISGFVNFNNVAVHEFGHFSGLGHSYIDGNLQSIRYDRYGSFLGPYPNLRTMATMFPYELNGSESRTLEEDDKVGLSHLYPTSAFYSTRGTLSGKVVSALDPTEPVFGAHVVAVDTSKKETVGVLSQKDGSFILDGLTPGKYRIFAEPIPFLETAADYWRSAELQFPQEFYSDQFTFERAQAFDVVANGLISTIEHTVLVGFSGVDVYEPNDTFLEFSDANPDAERFGLIDVPGDVDIFRFRALRGSLIHVEVLAQRQGTLMKPVLTIYNADEQAVAENSDYFGLNGDAQIDFRVPASGYYFVKVQHENVNEGGEGYYYRLSIVAQEKVVPMLASSDLTPVLSFELTTDKALPEGDTRQLHLRQITLVLKDVGPPYGDFGLEDLAAIANDISSGVSVFNDKGGTTPGVFEYNPNAVKGNDVRLPLDGTVDNAVTVTKGVGQVTVQIRFAQGTSATLLPFTMDGKPDFHVVIRTSSQLRLGDDFKVQIPAIGLLVADANGNYITAFGSPIPKNPSIYTGELIQLSSNTVVDQRIGLDSIPTAVIGINAVGDPSEKYFLSKVKFLVLGYSAKNYIPLVIDRFRAVAAPDTIVRATGSYGDFSVDEDLKEFFVSSDLVQGGGSHFTGIIRRRSRGQISGMERFSRDRSGGAL